MSSIAAAAIVHAFKEYCGGGGGGSADFVASAAPYVFAFYLAMGVRLVGSAMPRFGARGGGRGGPSGSGPGNNGKESNNSGGMDRRQGQWQWCKQLLPSLAHAMAAAEGGRKCLGIVVRWRRWGGQ